MNIIQTLSKSGFPEPLLKEYQNFCHELLPLQKEAIQNKSLFSESRLLIHAPTSAGKTFLAELAMAHTSLRNGKSVYLVPLRVQAEEMFRTLRQRYKKYGWQILISTSDYRHHDTLLEQGRFHIAVVVYEKMFQLIARQPSVLGRINLMIFDDIDLIFDPGRGLTADFLLTRCLGSSPRCIALSACLPQPERVAKWMNAQLIQSEIRPIPLRKGILYNGTFYHRNEDGKMGTESLYNNLEEISYLHAVRKFVERGETCLIFMKTRNEVRSLSWELTEHLDLPPAAQACEKIKCLEPTRARDALLHAFQHGVGFHHSDLLMEERQIVEEAFRSGELRVLVATSTLAKGLNLPVNNVFIPHEKWFYTDKTGKGSSLPLSLSEYENMAGRAGRYGYTEQPARAILIANSKEEKELLWSLYIEHTSLPFSFFEDAHAFPTPMLSVIASYETMTMQHIEEFFQSCWRIQKDLSITDNMDLYSRWAKDSIESFARRGFCMKKNLYHFILTPRGRIVATRGVSPETVEQLEHWLNTIRGRDRDPLDILLTASLTPDAWVPQFELSLSEFQSKIYFNMLQQYSLRTPWDVMTPIQKFQQRLAEPNIHEVKALKMAFVLWEWVKGKSLPEMEEEFCVSAGQVVQAGMRIAWILDVLGQLAELMNINDSEEFRVLSEQVRWGLPPDVLSLARSFEGLLTRSQILSLSRAGIYNVEQILKASVSELKNYILEENIPTIKKQAQKIRSQNFKYTRTSYPNQSSNNKFLNPFPPPPKLFKPADTTDLQYLPDVGTKTINFHITVPKGKSPKNKEDILLTLDKRRPGEVWLEGKKLRLPEKQYRLLCLLAQNAGCCVSYEEIYKELWNDIIVEDAQIAFQKCMLLRKLCEVSPHWKDRLRTIPKRGFMLDLPSHLIALNGNIPSS